MTENITREDPSFSFTIKIEDEIVNLNPQEDLNLDPDDLDEALVRHPSIYARYAYLLQKANLLAADAKFQYEKSVSEHLNSARKELSEGSKRVTDKQLTALIDSQPVILSLKHKWIELDNQSSVLHSFVRALEHKKECLMQLCNNRRKEMDQFGNNRVMSTRRNDPPIGAEG